MIVKTLEIGPKGKTLTVTLVGGKSGGIKGGVFKFNSIEIDHDEARALSAFLRRNTKTPPGPE